MDIFQFINSRDIRAYLKEIDYPFTTLETAYLVYASCRTTLEEKLRALQEIIDTMPDCPWCVRRGMPAFDSLHSFLREYIQLQRKKLERFYLKEDVVYSFDDYSPNKWYPERGPERCEYGELFSALEPCIAHYKSHYLDENVRQVVFRKRFFSGEEASAPQDSTLTMNNKLEVMEVDCPQMLNDRELDIELAFEHMWFDFPTPFKRGDIVVSCRNYPSAPMVLHSIHTWDTKKMMENGYSEAYSQRYDRVVSNFKLAGDTSDMGYYAYYIEDGTGIYADTFWSYLDLELLREPPEGQDRLLKVLSFALKDNDIDFEFLINACKLLTREVQDKKLRKFMESGYIKEYLQNSGVID